MCQKLGSGGISHPKKGKRGEITVLEMFIKGYEELQANAFCRNGKKSSQMGYQPWASSFWRRPEQPSRESKAKLVTEEQKVRAPGVRYVCFSCQKPGVLFSEESTTQAKALRDIQTVPSALFHPEAQAAGQAHVADSQQSRGRPVVTGEEWYLKLRTLGFISTKCTPCKDWGAG